MSRLSNTLGSFIADAPPGQASIVVDDIKQIIDGNPALINDLDKHLEDYNENQFSLAKDGNTVISPFNKRGDRYIDPIQGHSFHYDHNSGRISDKQDLEVSNEISELGKALKIYVSEHYPSESGFGVYPQDDGSIAVVIVDSKYSPSNFWAGRWKSWYFISSNNQLKGTISLDVHYYEDGNVRLKTKKDINTQLNDNKAETIIKEIRAQENKYQDNVYKEFLQLNEGSFKALRRQLPVTRSKMNWEKAAVYRLGKDVAGGEN